MNAIRFYDPQDRYVLASCGADVKTFIHGISCVTFAGPHNLRVMTCKGNVRLQALLLAAIVFSLAASASAQTEKKNEFGLLIGAETIPENSVAGFFGGPVSYGDSITYQLNYARRLKQNNKAALWLEVPALAAPSHSITSGNGALPTSLATFHVTPSFRVAFFPNATFIPWVSFGGGYSLFETSAQLSNGSANLNTLTNAATLQFGGGVDVKTPVHVFLPIGLRFEVRDFYTLDVPAYNVAVEEQRQHNVTFSAGLVLRF